MDQLARIVARNSMFGFAAQAAMKLFSFAFTVLIVRHLGAEDYGQYAAVLAFGAVFVFLADLGLSPYAVREVACFRGGSDGHAQTTALYGNVLALRVVLAVAASVVLVATAWLTGRPPAMIGAIAIGCIGLFLYSFQGSAEAVLSGFERLDLASGAKVLNQLVFVLVGAAMLLSGAGYYGLMVANVLGVALMSAFCWRAVRRLGVHPLKPRWKEWPALVRAGLPFGAIAFTLGLSYKFDSVLLNLFRGDAETGYYNAAYNLVFSAVLLSNVLNTSLYPSLVRQASTAPHVLPRVYERVLRYLLLLSLPIALGGWAAADRLVPTLFGSGYEPTVGALQILIWVVPLMFAAEFLGYVVVVQGQESRVARAIMVSTGLNVAINLLLVPRLGLVGAAVMTVVTEAILVAQYVWLLRVLLRGFMWSQVLIRPLVAAVVMAGVVFLLREAPLAVTVLAAGATYAGLLFVLRVIGPDELRFVRRLRGPAMAQEGAAA